VGAVEDGGWRRKSVLLWGWRVMVDESGLEERRRRRLRGD